MPYMLTVEKIERSLFPQLERRGRSLGFRYRMSKEDVQDIVNDSLLSLIEACPRLAASTNIEAYAERILRNKFNDRSRQSTRRQTSNFTETETDEDDLKSMTEEDSDFADDERDALGTLINKLDESCNEILCLHLQEYAYKDIAGRLSLEIGTVMSRISRCKQRLIQLANEQGLH